LIMKAETALVEMKIFSNLMRVIMVVNISLISIRDIVC
jgi:hypothetical protein